MSSLIFHTDEKQVFAATDTLAVTPDGTPFFFTTKAFVVPHLRMIMAGTGAGGFLDRWFISVNQMIVRGVDDLKHCTPESLQKLWVEFRKAYSFPDDFTTTVYHFGFSEITGVINSYAYRSTNNFRSEPLQYGLAIKPECTVPDNYRLPHDLKSMMDEQRAIQRSRPAGDQLYIGGEIYVHHLMEGGSNVYRLDRFDDYEQDRETIYTNLLARKFGRS